ncbi:hypothetical protein MKD41_10130 [Lutibacter sp. A64]|uniref:hypothetical protein n=1 Tax=Lutibacter sp. A64 TaxID=2918526 RepID=UPI001F06F695|nr:hypothetical protein [Lutibacter sp. A64]UMB52693.1 hypothetical protein MKD41_10130 [Lutibacter sp. A64]
MKNLIKKITVLAIFSLVLITCSTENKRNASFLPPLSIPIATEISGDAELVEVIKSSEKAMNEFSDNIEQLVIEGKDVLSKKEEDQTLMDGLKSGKLMVQFISNSTQMATLIEEFDTYMNDRQEQGLINDTQLKALEQVGTTFNARLDQINEKYKNYLEK